MSYKAEFEKYCKKNPLDSRWKYKLVNEKLSINDVHLDVNEDTKNDTTVCIFVWRYSNILKSAYFAYLSAIKYTDITNYDMKLFIGREFSDKIDLISQVFDDLNVDVRLAYPFRKPIPKRDVLDEYENIITIDADLFFWSSDSYNFDFFNQIDSYLRFTANLGFTSPFVYASQGKKNSVNSFITGYLHRTMFKISKSDKKIDIDSYCNTNRNYESSRLADPQDLNFIDFYFKLNDRPNVNPENVYQNLLRYEYPLTCFFAYKSEIINNDKSFDHIKKFMELFKKNYDDQPFLLGLFASLDNRYINFVPWLEMKQDHEYSFNVYDSEEKILIHPFTDKSKNNFNNYLDMLI